MKLKIFLRPALTVVFGFLGAYMARSGTPPSIFAITGDYFIFTAVISFAVLGFILPDIVEIAGRAGVTALAKQIAERIPYPSTSRISVPKFSIGTRPTFARASSSKYENPLVVDTSALIDGRVAEVIKTGFLHGTLLVIPSVIGELHRLADSSDDNRRMRGRRGLDVLKSIQKEKKIKVVNLNSEPKDEDVDSKLLALSKKVKGKLLTVDFNLNKVGKVKRVEVLNVNELANAVKTPVLPGDRLSIMISAQGREKGQGVGYLDDGTMVVVQGGAKLRGRKADVSVHRVIQTEAGKMIFAKIAN